MPEDSKFVARPLTVFAHQANIAESYTQPTGEAVNALPGDWIVYNPYTCMYQIFNEFNFQTSYQTFEEYAVNLQAAKELMKNNFIAVEQEAP